MSSPRTPHRRRRSSALSISLAASTPGIYSRAGNPPSHSHTSSVQSLQTPTTPRPWSSHNRGAEDGYANDFGSSGRIAAENIGIANSGLGNLADELAEGWDEDEEADAGEEEEEDNDVANVKDLAQNAQQRASSNDTAQNDESLHHRDRPSSSHPVANGILNLSGTAKSPYDGSEYGSASDFEETPGISPTLDVRISTIDALARQGVPILQVQSISSTDSPTVFARVAGLLRDLSTQAGVESHTMR